MQRTQHTLANGAIQIIFGLLYIGLLILFGWQTFEFLNFLFPADQLLMKILTLISFDILALLWGAADLFYRFASRGAKSIVRVAWVVTFFLSLLATILYMIIQSMFRFHVNMSQDMINIGYAISIIALVYNILSLMFFLYFEYNARNPRQDDFFLDQKIDTPAQRQFNQDGTYSLPAGWTPFTNMAGGVGPAVKMADDEIAPHAPVTWAELQALFPDGLPQKIDTVTVTPEPEPEKKKSRQARAEV